MPTEISESVRLIKSNEVVRVDLIPIMRSIKVFFRAVGLRPNTRHFPFFDDVRVDNWCREESYSRVASNPTEYGNRYNRATEHPEGSSNLFSDGQGTIEGSFFIPNTDSLKFRTGTRKFKLLDISVNNEEETISSAFINFTSSGQLKTVQDTYLHTRIETRIHETSVYIDGDGK